MKQKAQLLLDEAASWSLLWYLYGKGTELLISASIITIVELMFLSHVQIDGLWDVSTTLLQLLEYVLIEVLRFS